jgi:hypothetical protein
VSKRILEEIERQLNLKSEITCIGPPHVLLNGVELRTQLTEALRERDEARKDTDRMCKALDARSIELHALRAAVGPLVEAVGECCYCGSLNDQAEMHGQPRDQVCEPCQALRAYHSALAGKENGGG